MLLLVYERYKSLKIRNLLYPFFDNKKIFKKIIIMFQICFGITLLAYLFHAMCILTIKTETRTLFCWCCNACIVEGGRFELITKT